LFDRTTVRVLCNVVQYCDWLNVIVCSNSIGHSLSYDTFRNLYKRESSPLSSTLLTYPTPLILYFSTLLLCIYILKKKKNTKKKENLLEDHNIHGSSRRPVPTLRGSEGRPPSSPRRSKPSVARPLLGNPHSKSHPIVVK
jgi:hypothetical protein